MTSFPSVLESVDDLSNEQIIDLFTLAENLERDNILLTQENSLKTPLIYTLFLEDSTRTKLSFATATKKLGAHYLDFPIHTSSMNKGENLEETLLTLKAQGADIVVIRSKDTKILNQFKQNPPIKLINGGDGINEHPTQALLDFYLIRKMFGKDLNNFTMGIAGDIIHSRVAHSLMRLLPRFGIKIALFAPAHFIPNKIPACRETEIKIYDNKIDFLNNINLLYLLRIQLERHNGAFVEKNEDIKKNYLKNYGFSLAELTNNSTANLKVFHPGPVNPGFELDHELLKSDRYLGIQEVEVSIPVRMAILLKQLNNNDETIKNAQKIQFSLL